MTWPAETVKDLWNHYMGLEASPIKQETRVSQTNSVVSGVVVNPNEPFFPFQLDDLLYWVMKRKDGMVVKYRVVGPHEGPVRLDNGTKTQLVFPAGAARTSGSTHYGEWCKHDPAEEPVWTDPQLDLYIANANGCRGYRNDFDIVLDCGNILPLGVIMGGPGDPTLQGDKGFVNALSKFATTAPTKVPKFVKIDWDDREAPPLKFEFWPALYKRSNGTLLTACQGGHGRSGTSLVCLMMVANPDYTPADAIIHLRAIHCSRAIESIAQHKYIGEFGAFLGRPNDIERVSGVKDFKAEFMTLKHKSSKMYQDRLDKLNKEKK